MSKISVYNGKLQINRGIERCIFVLFDDTDTSIIEISIPMKDVGDAFFGDTTNCLYIPTGINRIGKVIETKQEEIFVEYLPSEPRHIIVDKALEPYEIDGWVARRRDLQSPRTFVRHSDNGELQGAYYDVRFERYVEPTQRERSDNNE